MKKYFFIFIFLFTNVFASEITGQIINTDPSKKTVQELNISTRSAIEKTNILFLEPCNIVKVNYKKDDSQNTNKINNFINKNIVFEDDVFDQYTDMSITQKNIVNKVIDNVEANLNTLDVYNFRQQKNICGKLNEYLLNNNNKNIDDFVLNNYNAKNDYVIVNNLTFTDEGKMKLEVFIWDMLDSRVVGAQYFIISENMLSRISNIMSDFIYTYTTNESIGIFDSKIIYVSETGKATNRKKTIKTMDFNGNNNKQITDNDSIIISPTFSRINKDDIYYLEYKNKKANFFRENIVTKEKNIIKISSGIIFAPNFNPKNNNQLVLSIANEGGTNLYLLDMLAEKYSKITNNKFINTSANFSPSGNKIIYVSDKTGVKKLYVYDVDTRKSERITKNSGAYDRPVWSPDGKLIAFIKTENNKFKLGLMTPDGGSERYITESYLIEGLKWSPNSRYIMFSKQRTPYGITSIPKLYIIDILTNKETLLNTPEGEGAVDPDWIKL